MAVLEQTGLLPPESGVMSLDELNWLRPVAPSIGMMLGTTTAGGCSPTGAAAGRQPTRIRWCASKCWDAGAASCRSPPASWSVSLRTSPKGAQSLLTMAQIRHTYGHIQEVIVRNFQAKPDTAMRGVPDAECRVPVRGRGAAGDGTGCGDPGTAQPGVPRRCAALIASGSPTGAGCRR